MGFGIQATPDAKKESFRKYLDSAGLIDSLTRGVPNSFHSILNPDVNQLIPLRSQCSLPCMRSLKGLKTL